MTDPHPVLDGERPAVAEPIRYVSWVHFGDPGYCKVDRSATVGAASVAWALYFDGERIERKRGEAVRDPLDPKAPYLQATDPDDPWWMLAKGYRERVTSWQASGGAMDGTIVTFWVAGDEVEIDSTDRTRLRVKVCGRDILTPLGYPIPSPPADTRYPVQVHMFVNRLTVGPMLGGEAERSLRERA